MKLVLEREGFFEETRFIKVVTLHQVPQPGRLLDPERFYFPQVPYRTEWKETTVNCNGIRQTGANHGPTEHRTYLITEDEYRRWARWLRNKGYSARRVFCDGEPIDFAPVAKCLF